MGKTTAEKIFDSHRVDTPAAGIDVLRLDAVFCHEITTPIAINDLVTMAEEIGGVKLNTYYHWLAMAWLITLTTNPAISLPCGTDAERRCWSRSIARV